MCDFTLRVLRTGVKWGQSHTSWRHCYLNWHSQHQFHSGARPHVPASPGLAAGDYTLGSSILPCQPCACLFWSLQWKPLAAELIKDPEVVLTS